MKLEIGAESNINLLASVPSIAVGNTIYLTPFQTYQTSGVECWLLILDAAYTNEDPEDGLYLPQDPTDLRSICGFEILAGKFYYIFNKGKTKAYITAFKEGV